jgi:hypothetical protein
MALVFAKYFVYVDWDGDGDFSESIENITDYVIERRWHHGRASGCRLADRSEAGVFIIEIDNSSDLFSDGNSESDLYGLVKPGLLCRITMKIGAASEITMFQGDLDSILPQSAATKGEQTAILTAFGPLARITDRMKVKMALQTAITTGTAFTAVLDAAGFPAGDRSVDTGLSTMGIYWTEEENALTAIRDLETVEAGFIKETKDGALAFKQRDDRYTNHGTAQATYTNDPTAALRYETILPIDTRRDIFNVVTADVRVFDVSEDITLWELSGAGVPILASQTVSIDALFPNAQSPAGYVSVHEWTFVDYEGNSAADGSGTDETEHLSVVATKYANKQTLAVTNSSGSTVYLIVLRTHGVARVESTIQVTQTDAPSIATNKCERSYPYNPKFLQAYAEAAGWIAHILELGKDKNTAVTLTLRANASSANLAEAQALDIDRRIHLHADAHTGLFLDADFYVERVEHWVHENLHDVTVELSKCRDHAWGATSSAYTPSTITPTTDIGNPSGASGLTILTNADDPNIPSGHFCAEFTGDTVNFDSITGVAIVLSEALPAEGPYQAEREAHPSCVIETGTCIIKAGSQYVTGSGNWRSPNTEALERVLLIHDGDDSKLDGEIIIAQAANSLTLSSPIYKSGTFAYAIVKRWWDPNDSGNTLYHWFPMDQLGSKDQSVYRTPPIPSPIGGYYATCYSRNRYGVGTRLTSAYVYFEEGYEVPTTDTGNPSGALDFDIQTCNTNDLAEGTFVLSLDRETSNYDSIEGITVLLHEGAKVAGPYATERSESGVILANGTCNIVKGSLTVEILTKSRSFDDDDINRIFVIWSGGAGSDADLSSQRIANYDTDEITLSKAFYKSIEGAYWAILNPWWESLGSGNYHYFPIKDIEHPEMDWWSTPPASAGLGEFYVTVYSRNRYGYGTRWNSGEQIRFDILDSDPPSKPTILVLVGKANGSYQFSFGMYDSATGMATAFAQQFQIARDAAFEDLIYNETGALGFNGTWITTELNLFYFRGRTQNLAGWSDWSDTTTLSTGTEVTETADAAAPGAVQDLTLETQEDDAGLSGKSLRVSFKLPATDYLSIFNYSIEVHNNETFPAHTVIYENSEQISIVTGKSYITDPNKHFDEISPTVIGRTLWLYNSATRGDAYIKSAHVINNISEGGHTLVINRVTRFTAATGYYQILTPSWEQVVWSANVYSRRLENGIVPDDDYQHVFDNLEPGVYYVRVRACNEQGFGAWATAGPITLGGLTTTDLAEDLVTEISAKTQTFMQDGIPTSLAIGDLWIDTDDDNKYYRAACVGANEIKAGEWEAARDAGIAAAIGAATTAQATADGKVYTFFQASIPTALGIGDLWLDSDDGNKLYRAAIIGANEIKAGEWEEVQDSDIGQAISDAADAQSTADGKIVSFYQDAEPTAEGVGDLWIDTNDGNKTYRWSGSAWVSVIDAGASSARLGLDSSGNLTSADKIAADGSTYVRVTANERTGGGRAYTGLDANGDVCRDVATNRVVSASIIAGALDNKSIEFTGSASAKMTLTQADGLKSYNTGGTLLVQLTPDGQFTLKSAAAGARIEIDYANGLRSYDSGGILKAQINSAGVATFNGATITGGTIQTAASPAERVVITGNDIYQYNSSNALVGSLTYTSDRGSSQWSCYNLTVSSVLTIGTPGGNIKWQGETNTLGITAGVLHYGAYDISLSNHTHTGLVTNGNSHDHNGGDGAQIAYANLSGCPSLGTAAAANLGTGGGDAAYGNHSHSGLVTNGDSHDHNGGDGGQIAYTSLSGCPSLGTAAAANLGTGSGDAAYGNHNHSGVYMPASPSGDISTSGGDVISQTKSCAGYTLAIYGVGNVVNHSACFIGGGGVDTTGSVALDGSLYIGGTSLNETQLQTIKTHCGA